MRYRVTTKQGDVHEFDSPFQQDSLRKTLNLPLTAKIEVIQPKEKVNEEANLETPAA